MSNDNETSPEFSQAVGVLANAEKVARSVEDEAQGRAQRITEDAHLEAERIVADAHAKAEAVTSDAHASVGELQTRIDQLSSFEADYVRRLRDFVGETTSVLNSFGAGEPQDSESQDNA